GAPPDPSPPEPAPPLEVPPSPGAPPLVGMPPVPGAAPLPSPPLAAPPVPTGGVGDPHAVVPTPTATSRHDAVSQGERRSAEPKRGSWERMVKLSHFGRKAASGQPCVGFVSLLLALPPWLKTRPKSCPSSNSWRLSS